MKWLETEDGTLVNLAHVARLYADKDGRLIAESRDLFAFVATGLTSEVLQHLKTEIAEFTGSRCCNSPVYYVHTFLDSLE